MIIEGNGIKIDERDLTRESEAMNKKKIYSKFKELLEKGNTKLPSPLILSGTNFNEGSGKGMVISVEAHF